jgi:hypothetical protein
MGYLRSTTLDELDRLDYQYSRKNNRPGKNLRNRIGKEAEIIFCYYEIRAGTLAVYILTDSKLIFSSIDPNILNDISLHRVKNVTVNYSRRFGTGGLRVYFDSVSATIFYGLKNRNFLHRISSTILKTKANFDVRFHSSTPTATAPARSGQESIAEQLARLAELRESGALTDDEYERAKGRILAKDL